MTDKHIKVRITFIEPILGSCPGNTEVYTDYIASKAPEGTNTDEELMSIEEQVNKQTTVFSKEDGKPFLWDYQIRGFFKGACQGLNKLTYTESSKLKAYKKQIDLRIFVDERKVFLNMPGELSICQRPLRASTPQGERIALAMSEEVPEGTTADFTIYLLNDDDEKFIDEWMNYGRLNGIGQWRNSGKGRFVWEKFDDNGNRIGGNK